jgi:hypothetical protein
MLMHGICMLTLSALSDPCAQQSSCILLLALQLVRHEALPAAVLLLLYIADVVSAAHM